MRGFDAPLPIDAVLPGLCETVRAGNAAVLVAPPGAGKTTRVPLALLHEPWVRDGKILVLEPRRLAARAAAERMAQTLGEKVGDTVGLRVRFGSRVSARTCIEVVTEGVFARLIIDDPELTGVAAVLFDEFHERSLDADLGLALARDAQQGLREDLRLLVMSATLDGARVARLLGEAPVVESQGRAFPVETRYLGRDPQRPIEPQVASAIARALRAEAGSILAFLPGAGEIRRTETLLRDGAIGPNVDLVTLYGALDRDAQDRAIAPAAPGRRKIVLATAIAETSITIEGVRIVVDCGLARVPRYEPDVGVTRLETVRVSRASADQRRGRAGRTEPGVCLRLWDEPQTASLAPFATPEILAADLSPLMLDLAQWGVAEPARLAFLDPPPAPAVKEARALLASLGALDTDGRITDSGRRLRKLPLPPRLARMVHDAAREGAAPLAAAIAALLTERGLGGDDPDLTHRLDAFRRDRSPRARDMRQMAERWAAMAEPFDRHPEAHKSAQQARPAPSPSRTRVLPRSADQYSRKSETSDLRAGEGWGGGYDPSAGIERTPLPVPPPQGGRERKSRDAAAGNTDRKRVAKDNSPKQEDRFGDGPGYPSPGAVLSLAYPERVAKNRGGGAGAFVLANGRGATLDAASPLAREPFLAVGELTGTAARGRILLAAPLTQAEIEARFADRIERRDEVAFDTASASLRGRRLMRLGALTLTEQTLRVEPDAATAGILAEGLAGLGIDRLPWSKPLAQWRDRVAFMRHVEGDAWPDVSDASLAANVSDWLAPALADKTALTQLTAAELADAVQTLLPWPLRRRLDTAAPTHFEAPSGSHVAIDYDAPEGPTLAIRVQELFGLDRHPSVADGRVPLSLSLLSPAHRPVQVTRDLPGFWRGSYAAVRAEMRGRYPRHPWPDNPLDAPATRRAKPRGT